jgi:hypothetical protein
MKDRLSAKTLAAFLAPYPPDVRAIAEAVRDVLLAVFPDAIETAGGKDLGYGFDRGYKGLVFTISLKARGVNLGVAGGATLEDPDGLLQGTGKVHRHVEILDVQRLKDPHLTALLERALGVRRENYAPKAARKT